MSQNNKSKNKTQKYREENKKIEKIKSAEF